MVGGAGRMGQSLAENLNLVDELVVNVLVDVHEPRHLFGATYYPRLDQVDPQGIDVSWWQGHEAWSNLCAGGTMGVVYGAGSLWQWRLHPNEPGHQNWCLAEGSGWREALDFEGSRFVGHIAHILGGLPVADMEPNWQVTLGRRGLLVPGRLYIGYVEEGGPLILLDDDRRVPLRYRVVDPRSGDVLREGRRKSCDEPIPDEGGGPRVYICCEDGL